MSSKEVGKIVTKDDADKLFGQVLKSVKLDTATSKAILKNTNEYVMFKIVDNDLAIFSERNKTIYGNYNTKAEDILHVFSKSKVEEVINLGGQADTFFEMRKEVFSITNGDVTVEYAQPCPPFC